MVNNMEVNMITAFLMANLMEITLSGVFLTGFSFYAYHKLKDTPNNKYKIKYCDVTNVIRQYKRLDKALNDSVGGIKNDKFFN
jgi:hypothetical protein